MTGPAERGVAALSVLVAAVVGLAGVAIGAGLVVGGAIDPLEESTLSSPMSAHSTSLLDCRGGNPIDVVYDGDEVFAVGIDTAGEWVAIRTPDDPTVLGWLPASQLDPASDLTDLPVQPCSGLDGAIVMAADVTSSTTTLPPSTTTSSTTTTLPASTTTTTTTPTTTSSTTTEPPDTQPPRLSDPLVMPGVIFPERCPTPEFVIEGSAYLTVEDEITVTATLSWSYLPPYEDDALHTGALPVEVLVDPVNILLIGAINDLPDPYPFWGSSAPEATVTFEWLVTDGAGNQSSATGEATVGRCP